MAFAAGLLHDAGKLVLGSRLPDRCAEAVALARGEGIPLVVAEKRVVGADHAELGAYLLGLWGLPGVLVDAVAHHHQPLAPGEQLLDASAAVRIANRLAIEAATSHASPSEEFSLASPPYDVPQAALERMAEWRKLAAEQAEGVVVE
jgi:HD-like signal output (HDOD) protein